MKFKHKNKFMFFLLLIIISSFVLASKLHNINRDSTIPTEELPIKDSLETIVKDSEVDVDIDKDTTQTQTPDTTEIYNEETKTFDKYIKVIKYEITEHEQEETFVFTEGREYIIGSNSNDIFIYFSKQTNTDSNKNMGLKFIENGKAITYVCKETEVHHLKFRVVSSKDKKDPYEATIYYVVAEK